MPNLTKGNYKKTLLGGINWKLAMIVVLIVLMMGLFNYLSDGIFLSQRNISQLLKQTAILGLVSSGMVVLIVARQIDLSAGASVYLVSVVVAQVTVTYELGIFISLICAIIVGVLMGAFQGVMVAKFHIPAFIVTLAGMLVFRGIGYVWTNAATIGPVPPKLIALSEGYISLTVSAIIISLLAIIFIANSYFSAKRIQNWVSFNKAFWLKIIPIIIISVLAFFVFLGYQGIPMAVMVVTIGVIFVHFLMANTKFGRNIYVIGGNPDAARLAGVQVGKHLFLAFIVMGVIYGVAGTLIAARLGSAAPTAGELLELEAIAAAVIGGTSFAGGVGVIPGALLGALLLSAIDNFMSIMNVSSFLQQVVKGLILLLAVWFDIYIRKKKAN